jgi:hypothetical protein
MAILDEIDSGLDIDALRDVSNAVNGLRTPEGGVLMVTHYKVGDLLARGGRRPASSQQPAAWSAPHRRAPIAPTSCCVPESHGL